MEELSVSDLWLGDGFAGHRVDSHWFEVLFCLDFFYIVFRQYMLPSKVHDQVSILGFVLSFDCVHCLKKNPAFFQIPDKFALTLCRAQHPKMSVRGRGQNVPKHPVAIGKLCCFQTRKFPYNLARISWIITVWDSRHFLLHHLHCLCVRSESERVF